MVNSSKLFNKIARNCSAILQIPTWAKCLLLLSCCQYSWQPSYAMIWQYAFIYWVQPPPRPASAGGPSISGSSSRPPSLEPAGRHSADSASRLLPRFLLAANLWTCPSWWCGWGWGLKVRRRAGWHRWDALFVKWLVEQVVVQLGKPSKSSPNFHFCMYPAHSVIIQSLVSRINATQQQNLDLP